MKNMELCLFVFGPSPLFSWNMSGRSTCFNPRKFPTDEFPHCTPGTFLSAKNASPPKSLAVKTSWSKIEKRIIASSLRHWSENAGLKIWKIFGIFKGRFFVRLPTRESHRDTLRAKKYFAIRHLPNFKQLFVAKKIDDMAQGQKLRMRNDLKWNSSNR